MNARNLHFKDKFGHISPRNWNVLDAGAYDKAIHDLNEQDQQLYDTCTILHSILSVSG
jgi:hypothetical protein